MPADEPNSIDIVAQQKNGDLILVISDHLDWSNTQEHQRILQIKLNTYLRFVESGEVFEKYPTAKNRTVSIEIVLFDQPDDAGLTFLSLWQQTFNEIDFPLTYKLFAESSKN